jgi:succinate dehydrogenase/fumarate reductase iron-sulfur protein
MRAKLIIYRFDPDRDKEPRYDTYEIDTETGETVLTALLKVYENFDASLSFRFACGKVKCGECAVMVNKSPYLACDKKVESKMIIEPLPHLPIIKDLVIDRNKTINMIFELAPSLLNFKNMADGLKELDSQVTDTYMKLTACFECLICQSICPLLRKNPDKFVGPLGLLWLAQMSLATPSNSKDGDNIAQMCNGCGRCWEACPSEVNFLEVAIKDVLNKQPPDKNLKK